MWNYNRAPSPLQAALLLLGAVSLIGISIYVAQEQQSRRQTVVRLADGFAALAPAEQELRLRTFRELPHASRMLVEEQLRDSRSAVRMGAATLLSAHKTEESDAALMRFQTLQIEKAQRLIDSGEYKKARTRLEELKQLQLMDARSRGLLAVAYLYTDDFDRSAELFEAEAQSGKVLNEEELLDFSYTVCKSKQPERAAEILEKGLARFPESAPIRDNLGFFYLELGRITEASEMLERALSIEPARANALNNLGLVREQQEQYATALELIRRAYSLDPKIPGLQADVERLERRVQLWQDSPAAARSVPIPSDQYCAPERRAERLTLRDAGELSGLSRSAAASGSAPTR